MLKHDEVFRLLKCNLILFFLGITSVPSLIAADLTSLKCSLSPSETQRAALAYKQKGLTRIDALIESDPGNHLYKMMRDFDWERSASGHFNKRGEKLLGTAVYWEPNKLTIYENLDLSDLQGVWYKVNRSTLEYSVQVPLWGELSLYTGQCEIAETPKRKF